MRRPSYRTESSVPDDITTSSAEEQGNNTLRESPEPMSSASGLSLSAAPHTYTHLVHHQEQLKSHSTPAVIKHSSNPIHHHIAPAFGAPFMKADGLVHRGNPFLPKFL